MNVHLVSRMARRSDAREPLRLTPREIAADELLSLENRQRYQAQSAATLAGRPAPIPPRTRAERYAREQMADHPDADVVAAGFAFKYGVAHDAG